MLVQVHTDPNIQNSLELTAQVEALVNHSIGHVADRVSRVQVHLGDENSSSKGGGNDKRCMIEAKLDGRGPISVTHRAATIEEAMAGAATKLERSINSALERSRGY